MINYKKCPFYRDSEGLWMGKGLGYCDLGGGEAICEGDINFCDKRETLESQLGNQLLDQKEDKTQKLEEKTYEKSYKVLVVDDEEPIRNMLVIFLSVGGHRCETAKDGFEALDKVKGDTFDAVITDIVMPRLDGINLTKRLLKLYPKLPILVMTGFSKDYPVEVAMEAGARDFIEKPFSREEFILRFNKMMKEHQKLLQLEEKQKEQLLQIKREALVKINEMKKELDNLYLKIMKNGKYI